MWLLGFLRSTLPVGLIHLLLIVAVISLVMHFFRGRSAARKQVPRLAVGLRVISSGARDT
jgi:hypothetical protein